MISLCIDLHSFIDNLLPLALIAAYLSLLAYKIIPLRAKEEVCATLHATAVQKKPVQIPDKCRYQFLSNVGGISASLKRLFISARVKQCL